MIELTLWGGQKVSVRIEHISYIFKDEKCAWTDIMVLGQENSLAVQESYRKVMDLIRSKHGS